MDWLAFQLVVIMALTAKGLIINTTTSKIVEKAVGDNVKLDCQFTIAPEDEGPLEVEWSVKSVRHPMDKAEVILYTAEHIYDDYYEQLKGRVYFHSEDPGKGDAAINLMLLTPSDTGIYYCQVKKAPGIQSIKTVLRVLKPPSKPRCWYSEGAGEVGKIKVLHCGSEEGVPPIRYHWTRRPPWELLSTSAVMDQRAGTLIIQDAIEKDAGTYECTAMNSVGAKECFLELNIPQPPPVGLIVGAVIGTLASIGIIASMTYYFLRHLRKKETSNENSETSNDILEDASPPKRRKFGIATRVVVPFFQMGLAEPSTSN